MTEEITEKEDQTDTEILGELSKFREPNTNGAGGRPRINRDLVIRNLKATDHTGNPRYTHAQIARLVGCSTRTIRRISNKAKADGLLEDEDRDGVPMGHVEADFNDETLRASRIGISFREWLQINFKTKSSANYHFNFTSKIWESLWEKCSMVEMADPSSKLADKMAVRFVQEFKDDAFRIRRRLKMIRHIFRFLKRQDICDAHLKIDESKHPRSIRKVPSITFTDYGERFGDCLAKMKEAFPEDPRQAELIVKFKIASQMRSGAWTEEGKEENRELWGIAVNDPDKNSYLIMNGPDEYQCHVLAKKNEEWNIIWLPKNVRELLWEVYQERDPGDPLINLDIDKVRAEWRKITKDEFGRGQTLHDMRKISLTWLYCIGVPLEVAANINVGWKDLSTAFKHYLNLRGSQLIRTSKREEYKANIPEWFIDGLDDFIGHDAIAPGMFMSSGPPR